MTLNGGGAFDDAFAATIISAVIFTGTVLAPLLQRLLWSPLGLEEEAVAGLVGRDLWSPPMGND